LITRVCIWGRSRLGAREEGGIVLSAHRSSQMTEAVTINNEELAILCDIVSGWGVKKWAENPGAAKKQSLDRLIAHGYVEPVHEASATRWQHTSKTEILFAQLCVGISGG